MIPANLPDAIRADQTTTLRCVCGAPLRLLDGRLLDGAGTAHCPTGDPHSPRIAPSPTGGWLRTGGRP